MLISFALVWCIASYLVTICTTTTAAKQGTNGRYASKEIPDYLEIGYLNVTSNLNDWSTDLAVMFYAPWCKYCKQLASSWEQISLILKTSHKNLVVGTFDCEVDEVNTEVCRDLGVDRYPSIYYIGYGNFNQIPKKGSIFSKPKQERVVRYVADLYPEAIYDWVQMLAGVSTMQRKWDDVKGFFTGNSRAALQVRKLKEKVNVLEKKVEVFGDKLAQYKADELFDSLTYNGDPYPVVHSLKPDEKNLPLRICVAQMASEYCKYHAEEEHCPYAISCLKGNLEPEECRPEKCPFQARGCKVVSACMDADVIAQYKKSLKV